MMMDGFQGALPGERRGLGNWPSFPCAFLDAGPGLKTALWSTKSTLKFLLFFPLASCVLSVALLTMPRLARMDAVASLHLANVNCSPRYVKEHVHLLGDANVKL